MANFNFNKVILGGRLCADPEVKTYESKDGKKKLARLRLAVNRRGGDDADFITCTAFDTRAEFIIDYFHKGDSICVEGRLSTGSYENDDRDIVYTTEVTVDSVHFVDSRNDRDEDDEDDFPFNRLSSKQAKKKAKKSQDKPTKASKGKTKAKPKFEEDDEDDDLPF